MTLRLIFILAGIWGALAGASTAVTFESAINNGLGGTFSLDPNVTYTGGVFIAQDTIVNGNGATVEVGSGNYLRCGTGTTVVFRNLIIIGGNGVTLGSDGVNFARFTGEGLIILNSENSGVESDRGRVNLTGCTIQGGVYGVYCYSGAVLESLIDCTISGQSSTGVFLNGTAALNIRNTHISNCMWNGVLAVSSPEVTIANCIIENHRNATQAFALSIQNSQNVSISENTIVRHSDKGIFLSNCPNAIVRDSKVEDCFYLDGISLQNDTSATIERCEVSLCQSGVAIVNGSSGWIVNSYFHNNLKKQTTPILGQGIFVLDASSAIIQGCTIVNNDNEGIFTRLSDYLVVEDCVIMENGWVANDGNGIFCDNTPGFIRNNKIIHNYQKGVQARTGSVVIEGNEIRGNGRGGITILDAPGSSVHVYENLVWGNGTLGGSDEEFNVTGNSTIATASNNLFSNSGQIGVLGQAGSYITLLANIIRNNASFGVNLYNANARLEHNVIFGSPRNIYHNGANVAEGYFNDIFAASVSGAEAINCSGCPLRYQNNWWGHASGPQAPSNPAGEGVSVNANIAFSPWLTGPASWYAVFEGLSIGGDSWYSQQAASMPWAKFWVLSGSAMEGQYLAAQASHYDLFIRVPKPFMVPPDTIHMWVLGSYEIRRTPVEAQIELSNAGGLFPNIQSAAGVKYDKASGQWVRLPARFDTVNQVMHLVVDDLQGLYLISPSGTLRLGDEHYSSQFYLY